MVCGSFVLFLSFVFSGPMMKLVYKLQAEDYKFDFPVSYLPVSEPLCSSSDDGGWAGARGAVIGLECHRVCPGPKRQHRMAC